MRCIQEVNQSTQRLVSDVVPQSRWKDAGRVKFACSQVMQPGMLPSPLEKEIWREYKLRGSSGCAEFDMLIAPERKASQGGGT